MNDEPLLQRKSLRLRGYDYARPGIYYVTTITHARVCLFGEISNGVVRLSEIGRIVDEEWRAIAMRRASVDLDAFVVMPNHVHGILRFVSTTRGEASLAPTRNSGAAPDSLGAVIGSFKAGVSRRVAAIHTRRRVALWQPGYQDHILRTDGELERIRQYIAANPANWAADPENPLQAAGARQASPPQELRQRSPSDRRSNGS